jgi:hypothetical protein
MRFIMDAHEMAIKTYEALQKRKKQREYQKRADLNGLGWNRANLAVIQNNKNFYKR